MPCVGVEHLQDSPENMQVLDGGGAESGAPAAPGGSGDPNLSRLLAAWDETPEGERSALARHVAALARMTPGRRAAIFTLTNDNSANTYETPGGDP